MTDNGLLVLDKNAVISAYGNVQLATSSECAFNRGAITLLATFRFGQKIADTSRVVKL